MGHPIRSDEIPLQPQLVLETFEKWAIHFFGPFKPPHKKFHIRFCKNYVMKWVEAEPCKSH